MLPLQRNCETTDILGYMANELKRLPTGIQTFSEIREGNYLYIDKMLPQYSTLCGITQEELETQMMPWVERLIRQTAEKSGEKAVVIIDEYDAPTEKMEVRTAKGRIDMVFQTSADLYVMELKIDRPASEALKQIDQKGYLLPYANDGLRLHKVGISFSTTERTLTEWEIANT